MKKILGSIVDWKNENWFYYFRMNKYFCILGGGGIRGVAYVGAIKALKKMNIEITGFAGSSIGSVVATLLTFGYTEDEIQNVFEHINFDFFNDINLAFGKDFAISRGEKFYEWIKDKIETKFYQNSNKERQPVKFSDIQEELIVFAVDLNTSDLIEFSKEKTPDVEIAHAIRASVGMPGLYSPLFEDDKCLVDGDLSKAAPLWQLSESILLKEEKIIEFRLEGTDKKKDVKNTIDYLNSVYDTVSKFAADYITIQHKDYEKYEFIKLNLDNISVVDFMVSVDKKRKISKAGYETTINYFKESYQNKQTKIKNTYEKILNKSKRLLSYIEKNRILDAKNQFFEIFSEIFTEKEILDKKIIDYLLFNKNLFIKSLKIKNGFFGSREVLLEKNLILSNIKNLIQKIENKLN